MAACNLGGASSIKFSKFDLSRTKSGGLHVSCNTFTSIRQRPLHFTGLTQSQRSTNLLAVSCGQSSDIQTPTNSKEGLKEKKATARTSQHIPNSFEVQSLLTEICDTTSIAEFELKLNGFRLYVTRDLSGKAEPSPSPSSLPVSTAIFLEAPAINGLVSTPSLAISPIASGGESDMLLDKAKDDGLVIIKSPKVGYFRRSRLIKKKRLPPSCKEKQVVKEGRVLCYIEVLGGQIPVETEFAGEVIKILRQDGEPVGYGDPLIAILPSFPGIKKLH